MGLVAKNNSVIEKVKQVKDYPCPVCGYRLILYKSKTFKYGGGKDRLFYRCEKYPKCDTSCGAHPDGVIAAIPADVRTKTWRSRAHAKFDKLWQSGDMERTAAYQLMQKIMNMTEDEAHIGFMNADQCKLLIERLKGWVD